MGRNILAVIAGMAVAMGVFMLFEELSHSLNPTPKGFNFEDRKAVSELIANTPASAFLIVLAGYIAGSVLAGYVIRLISKSERSRPAAIAGALLTVAAIINFYTYPHPMWFMAASIIVYIPAALIGYRLKKKKLKTL